MIRAVGIVIVLAAMGTSASAETIDSLHAWIEGTRDGKTRRIEFPYARVSCADAPRD